jgi:hypothetical protein
MTTRPIATRVLASSRPRPPFAFVFDEPEGVPYRTRAMFGCTAVCVGAWMVLTLREKATDVADNGVWVVATTEHHAAPRRELPGRRPVSLSGPGDPGTQNLPAEAPDFEASVACACELIRAEDPRIGRVRGARERATAP